MFIYVYKSPLTTVSVKGTGPVLTKILLYDICARLPGSIYNQDISSVNIPIGLAITVQQGIQICYVLPPKPIKRLTYRLTHVI